MEASEVNIRMTSFPGVHHADTGYGQDLKTYKTKQLQYEQQQTQIGSY
jgi:hypothetical protein